MREGIIAALDLKFDAQSLNVDPQSITIEALSMNFLPLSTNLEVFYLNVEGLSRNVHVLRSCLNSPSKAPKGRNEIACGIATGREMR
jgi:hypothetical protein